MHAGLLMDAGAGEIPSSPGVVLSCWGIHPWLHDSSECLHSQSIQGPVPGLAAVERNQGRSLTELA